MTAVLSFQLKQNKIEDRLKGNENGLLEWKHYDQESSEFDSVEGVVKFSTSDDSWATGLTGIGGSAHMK